ncbi:MAG TPA: orotidine-5'-phosphate decarboxylase [Stellaceae bacterium]|jgi:orotidine-5'-phosphate decarboxylase|nr:orotidine-5'-phosphate decarboxylase [Stellaceae bacterium]
MPLDAPTPRPVPARVADRLIVALDLPTAEAARAITDRLDGIVSFYKLGLWLIFAPGFDRLLEDLMARGNRIFLDAKMFDIGETVKQGVTRAAERGVSFVTIHGDHDIVRAAVEGKRGTNLRLLAITVLTSIDNAGVQQLGYTVPVEELIRQRVAACTSLGCDGIIASPHDVTGIRALPDAEKLLVVTPGVRLPGAALDDHKRSGSPAQAIAAGADYLVVGRPIVQAADPAAMATRIIADMQSAA